MHRDIKPENVLLSGFNLPILCDMPCCLSVSDILRSSRCAIGALAIAALVLPTAAFGQPAPRARVSGEVIDAATGQPVAHADVKIVGTSAVATTDGNGRFVIADAPVGVFNIEAHGTGHQNGMASNVQVRAKVETVVRLILATGISRSNDLVSAGTITPISLRTVPFTIDRLFAEDLPVPSPVSAIGSLEGKVAGVTAARQSGAPGADVFVQLRTPIMQGDSAQPLYIVDGVMLSAQYPMSAQDIESLDVQSIEIIKGTAGAAMYGFRGMNGVIAITTNRGQDVPIGRTQFTVRNEVGNDYANTIGLTNSPAAHQFRVNAAGQYVGLNGSVVTRDKRVRQANGIMENLFIVPTYTHTDQFFQPGLFNTQSVALQQNRAATNFNLQYSRSRQSGTVPNADGLLRQTARFNIDQRWKDRLQVGLSASYATGSEEPALVSFFDLSRLNADINLRTPEPDGSVPYKHFLDDTQGISNPLDDQILINSRIRRTNRLINLNLSYRALSWLSFDAVGSYERGFQKATTYRTDSASTSKTLRTDSVGNGRLQGGATATRKFGLLTSRFSLRAETGRESYQHLASSYGSIPFGKDTFVNSSISTSRVERRVAAGLSNLNLDYSGKYIADVLVRREGTSLFGAPRQWTSFLRASAAWLLNEESWFPFKSVDLFKLHYSVSSAATPTAQDVLIFAPLGGVVIKPQTASEREFGVNVSISSRLQGSVVYATSKSDMSTLWT